jgi:hypothetical protein
LLWVLVAVAGFKGLVRLRTTTWKGAIAYAVGTFLGLILLFGLPDVSFRGMRWLESKGYVVVDLFLGSVIVFGMPS